MTARISGAPGQVNTVLGLKQCLIPQFNLFTDRAIPYFERHCRRIIQGQRIAKKSTSAKQKAAKIKETDLYPPLKAYFEAKGYQVKGEVGAADLVAVPRHNPDEGEPIIVEMKTGFTLSLFHQAVKRQAMTDQVYVAVPRKSGKPALVAIRRNKMLCRRLHIGLLTVRLSSGQIEVHCEPGPFTPRKQKAKKTKLLKEFASRHGDPNEGGMTSVGLMTSYRQGALRCAKVLHDEGACKGSYVAKMAGFEKATSLMAANHYGWFERVDKGIYGLTRDGAKALTENKALVSSMMEIP